MNAALRAAAADSVPIAVPPPLGHALPLSSGEVLLVPAELEAAAQAAIAAARDTTDEGAWRTAFGDSLTAELHARGLILVARVRQQSREAVSADTYSLALDWKHALERHLEQLRQLVAPVPEFGSLANHIHETIDALTGRAPPDRAMQVTAALRERVRALRLLLLGTPLEAPMADPPIPEAPEALHG